MSRATVIFFLALLCLPATSCTREAEAPQAIAGESPGNHSDSQANAAHVRAIDGNVTPDEHLALTKKQAKHPARQQTGPSSFDLLEEISLLATGGVPHDPHRTETLLEELYLRGYESLTAIRDFLMQGDRPGAAVLRDAAEQELRQALLSLLLQFDFPEVEDIALELLAGQPSPMEIWQLGRFLETQHQGKYTDSIRLIAQQALVSADGSMDLPGEFFQLLGETGNFDTTGLLVAMPAHRGAYASVALALIPDGSGLSVLEQDARQLETGQRKLDALFAIELLATQAHRHSSAAEALVRLAEQQLIPADLWPHVLALVAGKWVISLEPPLLGRINAHTINRPEGKQVIYRISGSPWLESNYYQGQRLDLLARLQQWEPELLGAY